MKEGLVNIGRYGEFMAAQYLTERGYKIIEKNLRVIRTEIDLIAEKDELIVFIEVKTRKNEYFGSGLEAVDKRKQTKLTQAASLYLARKNPHQSIACRFDVISIKVDPLTAKPLRIIHCKDAFR